MSADGEKEREAVERAFGAGNRARLLGRYLDAAQPVTPETAWLRVYELLLWIDRTTGLAHCYESDKCQPGRPWYGRSLAFHDWVSRAFGTGPAELGSGIDWLFRTAAADLAGRTREQQMEAAKVQRQPYDDRGLPLPGEDPELVDIIRDVLGTQLSSEPTEDQWQLLAQRIHTYVGQENKRKNLLGEGFEDTLAAIIGRMPGGSQLTIAGRSLLGDIPGFNPQGDAEKQKRVDLALWTEQGEHRVLVTSKWSVRADREEQFGTDFDAYVRVNTGSPFSHVLVTNEFDAARLKAACQRLAGNAYLFDAVVHVNPEGVLTAYGGSRRGAARDLPSLIGDGRLVSLEQWLSSLLS